MAGIVDQLRRGRRCHQAPMQATTAGPTVWRSSPMGKSGQVETRGSRPRSSLLRDPLLAASAVLVFLNAFHGLDHVRQGLGRLTSEVVVGGQALLLLALLPLVLSFRRHRLA